MSEEKEEEDFLTIQIPKGKPYVLIVFEGRGSCLAQVHKESVYPAQILSIAEYLRIEADQAFREALKKNPAGGLILPTRH